MDGSRRRTRKKRRQTYLGGGEENNSPGWGVKWNMNSDRRFKKKIIKTMTTATSCE